MKKIPWNKGRSWSKAIRRKIQLSRPAREYGVNIPIINKYRISKRTRFLVFKRDNFTCQYCKGRHTEAQLEVDHKIPRSRGGSDDMDNLITACSDCNRGKSNIPLG